MERWSGKVALVTGASAGIGASIVVELVKNGLIVVGLARRKERVEELKKQVGVKADNLHAFQGDVSKEEDIHKVFKFIKDKFGKIHVLVNNAGIGRYGNLTDVDPKFMREVYNVNVIGLSICTQQAFKLMKETGVDDGHIIHINSTLGHSLPITQGANVYPSTKYAVTALTETLRQELRFLKSNIKVSSISPGITQTEMMQAAILASNLDIPKERIEGHKAEPHLNPKDLADCVIYVLSTPPHVQVHELIIRNVESPY